MSDKAAERLLEGRAWDDFCEQIRRAGHMVNRFGDTANALDRTEWYRFMTRLMRNGFERFMENCEPDRPRLRDAPWRQGMNFQSPDQDHLLAEFIDGSHDYLTPPEQESLFDGPRVLEAVPSVVTLVKADLQCAAVAAASITT